jgi:cytochrome c oxidase subunit 2
MVTKLVILLVIVLGVVAIAQMIRVYELSSKLTKAKENEISNRDNRFNARLMLLFMFAFFGSFIWLMVRFGWTGRGVSASVHGDEIDWLMNLNLVIITLVFFLTNSLLFVFAFKYVKKPGVPALYYPHNNKLEMLWTVVPAMVLAVIIILGLKTWNDATGDSAPEAIRVELFSKQFDWTARYSGVDNKLGNYDYKLTTDNNELALKTTATIDTAIRLMEEGPMGIKTIEDKLNDESIMLVPEDREKMEADLSRKERLIRLLYQMKAKHDSKEDAAAWDDFIQKDTLYLCKGREYEFSFRSKDVIHSAWFPHFRAQINTVPGLETRFKFIPKYTTMEMRDIKQNEDFHYVLMCNKICGGAHYKMKMMVVVLDEAEYDNWVKSKSNKTFRDTYFPAVEEASNDEGDTPSENEEDENTANEAAVEEEEQVEA